MSRQRQHPEHQPPSEASSSEDLARAAGLDELSTLGNQALTERIGTTEALGPRIGLVLRIEPRDRAWSERLVAAVERSGLSAERKEAVTARLRWDQIHADDVSAAVKTAFGADTPELRAGVVAAAETATGSSVEEIARILAGSGLATEERAVELVRVLSLVRPLWDEEEEEDPPEFPDAIP